MSRDPSLSSVYKLDQPEKLRTVLEQDKPEDCLPCRVLGAGAFIGLGVYSYFSGKHQLQQQQAKIMKSGSLFGMRARQGGITSIAAILVGMGFWRLVN